MTPAYPQLKSAGAVFGSAYGFERPNWFSTQKQVRESSLGFDRANWFDSVAAECRNLQ